MANYTLPPEDEYDVLIEDDLKDDKTELCDRYDAQVLSAQLVPQLYSTIFVVGLLDNILVVLILVKYKGLKHLENIYSLNLTLFNFCFLLTLPFWTHSASHGGSLGEPMCAILSELCSIGLYGEVLFSVLLTVQKHPVFFHMRDCSSATRTVSRSILMSVLAWVIVILATLPELVLHKLQTEGQKYQCVFNTPPFLPADETLWKHFLTLKMNILVLVVPLFVFVFCCICMRKTLSFRERRYGLSKLVFAIMVVFLLMWAPYNVALFLSTFREHFSLHDCKSSYNLDKSVQITKIIATTHCCVNPLLCVFLDTAFGKYLCHLFHLRHNTPLQPSEESAQGPSREEHEHSSQL
ncbi:C-C chemokine receptor-like 2 [Carlito syrichta]|uniref:C-C chemokine receptor-like 2 n=1 Tax=Carlito syrichta TaxID=1868482 RepID=A0A1U7UU66_CARSF|nr:C-C chemokine receptor-like 2 [Carlito syrichta]